MSFNPKFAAFQDFYGFDTSVAPHWQMVPLDGEKIVYLENAAGMSVQILNAKVAQVSEETTTANVQRPQKRVFKLTGKSHGTTLLEVRKDNVLKTSLEIDVKKPKSFGLAFNFVTDKTGRTTVKNPSNVPEWLEALNEIYQPQTNVSFIHRRTKIVPINNNLGSEIDSIDANFSGWEWDVIVKERDVSADINLFFV